MKGVPRYALCQSARVWYALVYYAIFYHAMLNIDGTDVCLPHVRQDCMVWHGVVWIATHPFVCGTGKFNVVCREVKWWDVIQRLCDSHCRLQSEWREELSIKLLEEDPEKNADYLQAQVAVFVWQWFIWDRHTHTHWHSKQVIGDKLDKMDPSTFEPRACELLHGLGFTKQMMQKAREKTAHAAK